MMNLSMDDLKHVHKVLSSDVEECGIFLKRPSASGGCVQGLERRIEDDRRVLARIEVILGHKPKYKFGGNHATEG